MKGRIVGLEGSKVSIDLEDVEPLRGLKFEEAVEVILPGQNGGPLSGFKNRRKAQAGERLRIDLHNALEAYNSGAGFSEFLEMLLEARMTYDEGLKP